MLYNNVIRQGSRVRPRIDRIRGHDSFSSCAEHLTTCFANNIWQKHPATGKPDYYDSTSLSFSRKPSLDRAYSVSQESDVAILLRVDKGVAFCRYENLAKIKNRRSSPRSPLLILLTPVAIKTPELKERVEKTPANMCANALLGGREKGE